jgi:hypothetical protein
MQNASEMQVKNIQVMQKLKGFVALVFGFWFVGWAMPTFGRMRFGVNWWAVPTLRGRHCKQFTALPTQYFGNFW